MVGNGILSFHAHPDDEVLLTGGTLAACAANGVPVTVVFATRGELGGRSQQPTTATQRHLAKVREQEARAAAAVLGVRDVLFLGYLDSGHTPRTRSDPSCFASADFLDATGRLVEVIRSRKPRIVIAYDAFGGYGHVDHVQVHRVGTAAFFGSGDADRFGSPNGLDPWQALSLYWATMPSSRGRDSSGGTHPAGLPEGLITTQIDVSGVDAIKREALAEHKSQFGPQVGGTARLEETVRFDIEYFVRAFSVGPHDRDDLQIAATLQAS